MSDVHANYVRDLGLLVRKAGEAAKAGVASATANDREYEQGRQMAYYEVLSRMKQQAVAFDLPLRDLSLEGFDADRDML